MVQPHTHHGMAHDTRLTACDNQLLSGGWWSVGLPYALLGSFNELQRVTEVQWNRRRSRACQFLLRFSGASLHVFQPHGKFTPV